MGFWSPFTKAGAYHFTDSTVQVLNTRKNDGSVLYEMELYDGEQSMSEQNKEVTDMNEWDRLHRQAQRYKEAYPPGTRIMLLGMGNDPNPVESGTRGTVRVVDDIGTLHLMMVLSSIPDIEITCTDSSECFDDNKAYLHERLEYEQNPKVRKLIKKDIEFLDNVQVEMATARQFLFTARIKASKDKQVFDTANRVEKIISEQGFEVRRMRKADIKRFLALYFEASMNGEQMPDFDGEQFYEVDDDEEDEA